MTQSSSTYKIPTISDWPDETHVEILDWSKNREETIFRSKGIGEPPLMLAFSVFHAIKDAIASIGQYELSPELHAPATPEQILTSIEQLQARMIQNQVSRGKAIS